MRRGEIWTTAGHGAYTNKPRPVLIIQDDRFDDTASITVCAFTSTDVDAPLLRIGIEPTQTNGLTQPSNVMIDKATTMPRASLGTRLGQLSDQEMLGINRALVVFLGIA